jgi:hypothetical protein
MEQRKARLRKAFNYKDDADSSSEPEALDEEGPSSPSSQLSQPQDYTSPTSSTFLSLSFHALQTVLLMGPSPEATQPTQSLLYDDPDLQAEQDTLIQTLRTTNETRNAQYRLAFTVLACMAGIPYIPTFYSRSSTASAQLVSLLAVTSLLASAYYLYALPESSASTGLPWVDAWFRKRSASVKGKENETYIPRLGDRVDKSPLELYLPSLNVVLAALVAVIGMLDGSRSSSGKESLGAVYALLPAGVFALVILVKRELASVDVGELERLKYGYKGA